MDEMLGFTYRLVLKDGSLYDINEKLSSEHFRRKRSYLKAFLEERQLNYP